MRFSAIQVISTVVLWTLTLIFDASSSDQGNNTTLIQYALAYCVHLSHHHQILPKAVSVCPRGQLNLICLTTQDVTLLQWNIVFPDSSDPEIHFISSGGSAESAKSTFTLGQTVFRFSRTSSSPMTSLIVIDNVTTSLNGTRVEYSYSDRVMTTTVINVIENGMLYNYVHQNVLLLV